MTVKFVFGPCGAILSDTTKLPVAVAVQFAVTVNDWPGARTRFSIYCGSEFDRQITWPFSLIEKTVVPGPTPTVTSWSVSLVPVSVI